MNVILGVIVDNTMAAARAGWKKPDAKAPSPAKAAPAGAVFSSRADYRRHRAAAAAQPAGDADEAIAGPNGEEPEQGQEKAGVRDVEMLEEEDGEVPEESQERDQLGLGVQQTHSFLGSVGYSAGREESFGSEGGSS